MTVEPSKRSAVSPFLAMDVLARANSLEAGGRDIVHLEVGQPGAPVPDRVVARARELLETGRLGYTEALGIPPLRAALAAHYRDWYGLDVPEARIIVTTGSSGGFVLAFLAAFDTGARIGLPMPGYPAYRNIMHSFGLEAVDIPTRVAEGFAPTAEAIRRVHAEKPLDGLLIASPNNPTGTVIAEEALRDIVTVCDNLGITLISDEIYHGLTYGAPAHSVLETSDMPIVINSFSKYYCMTGWRIGWMIIPEVLQRPVERLTQNLFICAPELSQWAAIAALGERQAFEATKATYAESRALLMRALPELGFTDVLPMDGAFYAYAGVTPFSNDSLAFARAMLDEAGVAATPGADFDPKNGQAFIRFSYAGAPDRIALGLKRLKDWLPGR